MDAMDWNLTSVGLPNTCSRCGSFVDVETGWYAPNADVARAGGGVCAFDYERGKHITDDRRPTTDGAEKPPEADAPIHAEHDDLRTQRKRASKG